MIKMNANHMFFFCSHLFVPSENNQSKKSVLLRGAEVFCVIEIVSAQIQARCAQLSCCNTTTQSAAASGAHEHFWHVVIPPDMVGKLIFHRSRKGNDKETNQFFVFVYWNNRLLFQLRPSAAVKKAYRICHRTLLSLYIYYQAVKTQTCLRGKQCTFFLKWTVKSTQLHSCLRTVTSWSMCNKIWYWILWISDLIFFYVFCIFVAELHFLSSFCTGFLRYLGKVIYKVFVNYFSNNSILGPHWPLLHDAKIISIIDQIGSVLRRRPHYSQQGYRNKTWCDEQAAGGWLMSYWATKSCYIGFVLNCVEQKKLWKQQ